MSLSDDLNKKKFDKRLFEWNLKNKVITQSEHDQHIQSLEDRGSSSEYLELSPDNGAAAADGANLEH